MPATWLSRMEEQVEASVVVAARPRRNRLTGQVILAVLLVTFPLLAWLVMEQGRVIDAQRLLIQQLSADSQQLNAMKVREIQDHAKQTAPASKTDDQAQSSKPQQKQKSAPPEHKNRTHRSKEVAPPPPPQEYPASRQVPVRKGA